MIYYSQRDKKWGEKYLGFSRTKIKDAGCTITCLAMVAGLTPDEANERLKKVNGFAQKNLVIWKKITCLGLEFIWRGYKYENEKVKEAIRKYGFCLVNVLAGKVKHWVLFIGNQKMIDPWDGREKSTSTYKKLLGYCIIKEIKASEIPYKKELEECLKAHKSLMDQLSAKDKEIEKIKEVKEDYRRKFEKEKAERESYDNFIKRLAERLSCPAKMQDIEGEVQELVEKEDGENKVKREFEAFRIKVNEFFEKLGDILHSPPQEGAILEVLYSYEKEKMALKKEVETLREENLQQKAIIKQYQLRTRKEVKEVKENVYPKWKKVIWRLGRVFFVAFLGAIPAVKPNDLRGWFLTALAAGIAAGLEAIGKTLREIAGDNYESILYKLPI